MECLHLYMVNDDDENTSSLNNPEVDYLEIPYTEEEIVTFYLFDKQLTKNQHAIITIKRMNELLNLVVAMSVSSLAAVKAFLFLALIVAKLADCCTGWLFLG